MNSIYKVIWSKAKNCYVVASEIAKSHTKSASGSEKMGGYGKRALLALAAASAIFCGGLVNVGATVHVDEVTGGANEVYTTTEVNTALDKKADKDSVYSKADTLSKTEVNTALDKKADKDSVYSKADTLSKTEVNTALDKKADKDSVYTKAETYTKTEVNAELAKKADASNVFTKDQTFTKDQVNTKLADYAKTTDVNTALAGKANVGDSYTKAEADGKFATSTALDTAKNELDGKITANTAKITANETAITNLNNKAATTDTTLTNLSGRMTTAESDIGTLKADVSTAKSDIGTLKADMTTAKSDIGTLKADVSTAKSDINSLKTKDTELTGKIEAEIANRITSDTALDHKIDAEIANRITSDTALDHKIDAEIANRITSDTALDHKIDTEIQDRKDAIKATNDRTGGIARNLEGTQTTIEGIVKVDKQGNVKDVNELSAKKITTTEDAVIGGKLGVTGETTLNDKLTAKGEATFEKNVTVEKDLTVDGELKTDKISMKNTDTDADGTIHNSSTTITADGITHNGEVKKSGVTTESQFTHTEKGSETYAKRGDATDWTETRSDVTADGVNTEVKDSKGNRTNTSQTASENKTYLEDKDSKNTNSTIDTAKGYDKTIKGENGETSTKQDELNITNTAQKGTITNDAKDIVNNATGNLTTTVGGNELHEVTGTKTENVTGMVKENYSNGQETNVTGNQDIHVTGKQTNKIDGDQENTIGGDQTTTVEGNAKEDYKKDLTTTVGGNELHEVTGTKTENVTGMVKENYSNGQETNVTGNQDIHVTGKQTNKIDGNQENTIGGDQTTNVTGDISNKAENITNEAKTSLTDKVGTNTRVTTSRSITDTVGATTNRMIEDGKITDYAGDSTVTTEKDKGTTFTKRGSMAYRDGGPTDTNISGNTITTGKVTMDYAEVMKDLGVHGSAKVDNNLEVGDTTTTKTLKVTENATVGGTLDVTGKATFSDDVDIKKNLSVDGNATIKGDVTASSYKVGRNTYIDANGINANNQKITNVADGSISEGSKDAVNGGQLYTVKNDLEGKVNKVGANAAAMANLHPMEFDPDSKWNIAAAIGNYGSETAAALGAFYRPNDDVMVNLSTAFGTGENMVGGGVSVRLGKGGNKLSREENNALKAQVDDLTARMDALLSVLNPNMSKDFPDVPENHWAYEAVSRLAGNDIVQGYPDGEFHGERTMTRYEMAEIIYNALSRGAEAEKELVEEFKPELQAMAASEKATAERAEG